MTDRKERVVIGIDPGLRGAIAILGLDELQLTGSVLMPIHKFGKRNQVDLTKLIEVFISLKTTFAIETVSVEHPQTFPGEGAVGAFSYGLGFGMILATLKTLGIPFATVKPQAWKGDVLTGTQRDKSAAVAFCQNRFPSVELYPGRMTKPHDGVADAFCIAEHARRSLFGRGA